MDAEVHEEEEEEEDVEEEEGDEEEEEVGEGVGFQHMQMPALRLDWHADLWGHLWDCPTADPAATDAEWGRAPGSQEEEGEEEEGAEAGEGGAAGEGEVRGLRGGRSMARLRGGNVHGAIGTDPVCAFPSGAAGR